jgi:hypothetical protein
MPPYNNAQLEQRLQESEQRFRLTADTTPVLIWMSGKAVAMYPNRSFRTF